jgi:hypothetical protein
MGAEAVHPGELVGELLGADRIAVGKIDRRHHDPACPDPDPGSTSASI